MGIRPEDVTAEMYKRFDEATQKRYEEIGALKALPDPESRAIHKFERDHQRRVVALFKKNVLVCGWSGTL